MTKRRFGSIRKLPSGRWQATYSAPNGRRVTAPKTFRAKADCEAWLADRRREIDAKLWNPHAHSPQRTLFGVYAARWLTNRELRPRTRESYERILTTHLAPTFGDMQLAAIAPADVRDWHATLLPGKAAMRAQCYAVLRAVFNTALADELIPSNPCRIRGAGHTDRVRPIRPATVSELDALTAAMPERLQLGVLLASWCGLRYGEQAELRRHDVDLGDEVIRVRRAVVKLVGAPGGHVVGEPKSRAGIRDVTIPPHLIEAVERHLAEHVGAQRDSLLFPSVPGGQHHLSLASNYRAWDQARRAVGRPDLRWHDLRHTGLTMVAIAGATTAEIMARGGHSTPAAALRYQHVARGRDREIAGLLSKLANDTP